eukprot:gnl/TRDRNA2_/TRDRNA2_154392_c1_seq2.p1 gnl/TRDRNA2_/TRDRNA2_154392_c1~~gnl/TRDRNA2_/TRDRNA2_154392_c1_seq2.p1  ORF type:complete len:513 (-),score=85.01 gnl/TRDRNA2_/TRDRNA2_154392_c1_seq2:68-1606(-)
MGQAANGAATQQLQCCQCSDDEDPKAQLHASLDEANGCVKPLGAPELALSEEPPAALFGRSVPNSPESADSRLQPKAPSPATASHGWQWCEHTGAAELAALVPAASSQVLEAKRVGSTINRWSFSEQHGENTPAGLSQEDEATHEQETETMGAEHVCEDLKSPETNMLSAEHVDEEETTPGNTDSSRNLSTSEHGQDAMDAVQSRDPCLFPDKSSDQKPFHALPDGCEYHFYLSHDAETGVDQASTLHLELEIRGLRCWCDNQNRDISREARLLGVRTSDSFLLFLSEGVLKRTIVQLEIYQAIASLRRVILVHESDARHHPFDWDRELQSAPADIQEFVRSKKTFVWQRRNFERSEVLDELVAEVGYDSHKNNNMLTNEDALKTITQSNDQEDDAVVPVPPPLPQLPHTLHVVPEEALAAAEPEPQPLVLGLRTEDGHMIEATLRQTPLGMDFERKAPIIIARVQAMAAADQAGVVVGAKVISINGEDVSARSFSYQFSKIRATSKFLPRG